MVHTEHLQDLPLQQARTTTMIPTMEWTDLLMHILWLHLTEPVISRELDTVRYQGTAVDCQLGNGCLHTTRTNAAILKAEAGNWGTDDAQHAWDEGWAFFHGPMSTWMLTAKVMEKELVILNVDDGVAATPQQQRLQ